MSDLKPEHRRNEESGAEVPPAKPQSIQVLEGNTGTLTVRLVNDILSQLKEMNYYLAKLAGETGEKKDE